MADWRFYADGFELRASEQVNCGRASGTSFRSLISKVMCEGANRSVPRGCQTLARGLSQLPGGTPDD